MAKCTTVPYLHLLHRALPERPIFLVENFSYVLGLSF